MKLAPNYEQKFEHINSILHESKLIVFATDQFARIWYSVKQDGFEDTALDQNTKNHTGWEDWKLLELPGQSYGASGHAVDESEDLSVLEAERSENTFTDSSDHYITRSRYKTHNGSSRVPVQLVSGLGHLFVFRQSAEKKLLVDRFVLDGMKNRLNRKLEVRFKRSAQRYKPFQNTDSATHGHLQTVDSLDFRDANGLPFFEPSIELSWLGDMHKGWFSVVLLPTDDHDVHRWHIFYLTSEYGNLEYASLKSSKDDVFDFKDHFVVSPKKGTVPGLIRRSFAIGDGDTGSDVKFTGGPVASQYDVQTEQDTESGPHLLREATRILVNVPAKSGVVSISFGAAKDGRLSHMSFGDAQDSTQTHLRATRREVILPLDTLDAIKPVGDTNPPPHGTFNSMRRGPKDRIEIVSGDAADGVLKPGDLIRVSDTVSVDGHYDKVSDVGPNQFSVPKPVDMTLSGNWTKIDHDTSGEIFDGIVTGVNIDEQGVEVTSLGAGLKDGDAVQIAGTEAINGLHRVASVKGTEIVLDRKWAPGSAVNLSRVVGNRRGVRFTEDKYTTDPSYGQTKPLDLVDLTGGSKGGYTISVWVFRSDNEMKNRCIFAQADRSLRFELVDGHATAFANGTKEQLELKDPAEMPLNTWVHFAVTIEAGIGGHGSDNLVLSMYRDGVEVALPSRAYTHFGPSWNRLDANQIDDSILDGVTRFGWHVDVSGDTAIISSLKKSDGYVGKSLVHIFRRRGDEWVQTYDLNASIAGEMGASIQSLSIDGDIMAIGMYDATFDEAEGLVIIFRRTHEGWKFSQEISDVKGEQGSQFGCAVALVGQNLFVGAQASKGDPKSAEISQTGAVYVFGDEFGKFGLTQTLYSREARDGERFGASISAGHRQVVIGAGGNASFRASFLSLVDNLWQWSGEYKFDREKGETVSGVSVALYGDYSVVGEQGAFEDGRVGGKVHLFYFYGARWNLQSTHSAADFGANAGEMFGTSVSMNADNVFIGSPHKEYNWSSGRVFVMQIDHSSDTAHLRLNEIIAPKFPDGGFSFGSALAANSHALVVGNRLNDTSAEPETECLATSLMAVPRPNTAFRFGGDLVSEYGFGGEIQLADFQVWNVVRDGAEIKNSMFAILSGQETGLSGYWRLGAIVPGKTPSFTDFSSYKNDADLVGQALLSDKTLDRYLQTEVQGHRVEATKYVNDDYTAVIQRGHYEEVIEFRIDDFAGAGAGLFKFIYWGKAHATSDTIVENSDRETDDMGEPLSLFSPTKPVFDSLDDGWMRLTGSFFVPDGVNLVRTFGLSTQTPHWEQPEIDWASLQIRKHSIVNLSDVVTEEMTNEACSLKTISGNRTKDLNQGMFEGKEAYYFKAYREIRHLKELIHETSILDKKIAAKRAAIRKHEGLRDGYAKYLSDWKDEHDASSRIAVLYYDEDYEPADNAYHIGVGRWELYGTGWDDIVTSLRVPEGLEVVMHRYKEFSDEQKVATEDCANVGHKFGYNDRTTSVTVRTKQRKLYDKAYIQRQYALNTQWRDTEIQTLESLNADLKEFLADKKYSVGRLTRRLAKQEKFFNRTTNSLDQLGKEILEDEARVRRQKRSMPLIRRDARGQQTFGAILGFVKPASRMTSFYSSTGNVQLNYLDDNGRLRRASFDAVADHLNSQFEEWLPDPTNKCVVLPAAPALISLEKPISLPKSWTVELWTTFPFSGTHYFPSVSEETINTFLPLNNSDYIDYVFAVRYDPETGEETLGTWVDEVFISTDVRLNDYSAGWHHIAAVADGKHLTLYIDGIRVGSVDESAALDQPGLKVPDKPCKLEFLSDRQYSIGRMAELRIWGEALNASEVLANSKGRLSGEEPGLLAYLPMQEGGGKTLRDVSGNGRNAVIPDSVANSVWTACQAPIGQMGDSTPTNQVTVAEYSRLSTDRVSGRKSATMMESVTFLSKLGVQAVTAKRIEELDLVWVGNCQFMPTLLGYIEGAPPVPSENLTHKSSYSGASSVTLTKSEDVDYSWKRSEQSALGAHVDFWAGFAGETSGGIGVEEKLEEHKKGVAGKGNWTNGKAASSKISSHSIDHTSDTLSLRGQMEHKVKFPDLGKRFVPKNVGYALVISGLADVFITKLRRSGRMIGYQITPVEDVPPDINTITFMINPAYTMAGSLDGLTGTKAASDRFYGHVPAMRAQYGSAYPASFFRLDEAYDLKQQVERQDKAREAYFENFDSTKVKQNQMRGQIEKGDLPGSVTVNRAVDKPVGKDKATPEEAAAAARIRADRIASEGQANATATSEMSRKKEAEIRSHLAELEDRDHATASFHTWQTKMEAIKSRSGKRNIVNNYVWDADGGMRTETQQFSNSVEHTIGGSFELSGQLGFRAKFFAGAVSADLKIQGTGKLVQSMAKTEAHKEGFGLKVDVGGVEHAGITDQDDYPILPGEKVDRYRFMSFYLDASTRNFTDFFEYVVDPEWLQSNDEEARSLRQAQGKANLTWRVLHRVTYVERPALMGFGQDMRALSPEVERPSLESQLVDLKSELSDLKTMIKQGLSPKPTG